MSKPNQRERVADEFVLHLLDQRQKGASVVGLAKLNGVGTQYVSTATNRVADADCEHDPEAKGYYHWRNNPTSPAYVQRVPKAKRRKAYPKPAVWW